MPQHSTWDDDDADLYADGEDGEYNGGDDNGDGDDDGDDDVTDWEDFDRSIRSDADAWCERVGAHRD